MQSCLDIDVSSPEPTVVTRVPTIDVRQGWAHSIGAPKKLPRPLSESLAGVPKAALRTIFDKSLAQKIWRSARHQLTSISTPPRSPQREMSDQPSAITDQEILAQMIAHLASQAAQTLRHRNRQAHVVRLQFTDATGTQRTNGALLLHPTDTAEEIRVAAQSLLTRRPESADPLASVNLTVEAFAPHVAPGTTSQPTCPTQTVATSL
jgi:nucleotidyltransferase/DNA polymerase involved in DNA repair